MTGDRPDDFDDLAARSRDRALRDAEAIADVESALAQVRSDSDAPTAAASSSGRRWVVLAAAAVVAVVTVSAVVWLARGADERIATSPVTTPAEQSPVESTELPTTEPPTTEPSTTEPLTTGPPTTEPDETDGVSDPCRSEAVAPAALVDGSAPGEPAFGVSGSRQAVWGGRSFHAVRQHLDLDVDPETFAAGNRVVVGDHEGSIVPVGDPPLGAISLYWQDPSGCVRWYMIASGFMVDEALDYLTRWLTSIETGDDFVAAFDPAFDAPTEYVAVRLVEAQFDDVRLLAPDGADLGRHPDVASFSDDRLPDGASLADGRRIGPARYDSGAVRCSNDPVTIDGEPLHSGLESARAINATPDGIVVAARDVCPDGAAWGDPGTRWELVRIDSREPDPQVEILLTREPSLDAAGGERHEAMTDGNSGVSAISPGGRLVALGQYTGGPGTEWTIRSLDAPDVLVDPPSRCPEPGPLVAAPVFVTDQRVVLARACPDGAAEAMLVETVDIDTGVVDHSVEVAHLAERSEFVGVAVSSVVDGGDIWTIVSISDLERATTAFLVRGDAATEITQPGYRTYAFTIDDLAWR